jgi:hypothetical protein
VPVDCDPLDEECARAAARAAGWDSDTHPTAWQIYVSQARTVRAVLGVLKAHDARIEAVADECAAKLAEIVRV